MIYFYTYDAKETVCPRASDCLNYLMAAKKRGNTDAMILLAEMLDTQKKSVQNGDWLGLAKAFADGTLTADGQPVKELLPLPRDYPSTKIIGFPRQYAELLDRCISDMSFSCYREAAIKGDIRGILAMGDKYYKPLDSEESISRYDHNNRNYDMAKQWYMKGVSIGSQEATNKLVKIVKFDWYYGGEHEEAPDQEVINFLKNIADGKDSTSTAIKPIVAAGALSDVYFYIWQILYDVAPGLPDPMRDEAYANVFTYSMKVANTNNVAEYSQILSDAEYRLGFFKSKGDLRSRKAAITWFDKAMEHCKDQAKKQKIAYERRLLQEDLDHDEKSKKLEEEYRIMSGGE